MKLPPTRAFILRTVNYKESDKILSLQTLSMGRISAIAKAARKSRKRFDGALETFALFEVTLDHNPRFSNMYHIAEAVLIDANAGLASSLDKMGVAAFILELTRELVPENEADQRIFEIIQRSMALLSSSDNLSSKDNFCSRELAIAFQLRILALCGFDVSVDCCNACGKPVPSGKRVFFDPKRGGVVCTPCGAGPLPISAQTIMTMSQLKKDTLEMVFRHSISTKILVEIECVLDLFLDNHLGKKLKSTMFRHKIGC